MKPLRAPNVPGNTDAERMSNALTKVLSVSKADLLKEEELVIIRVGVDHGRDFCVVRVILAHARSPFGRERRSGYGLSRRGSQRKLEKVPSAGACALNRCKLLLHVIPPGSSFGTRIRDDVDLLIAIPVG